MEAQIKIAFPCLQFLKTEAERLAKNERFAVGNHESIPAFVLKHGQKFNPRPLPANHKRGKPNECYHNAGTLALVHGLVYCEGYVACGDQVVEHAWCIDGHGNVVDPTLPNGLAQDYFGIPFKLEYVMECSNARGEFGILESDYMENWKTFCLDPVVWKFRLKE